MKILLIDDSAEVTSMLAMLLEAQGHSVLISSSGISGIAVALHDNFDIAIVDLGLPDIDGIEVVETLHQWCLHKSCRIFVYTGRSDLGTRREAIVAGASYFLVKGGDITKLLDKVL